MLPTCLTTFPNTSYSVMLSKESLVFGNVIWTIWLAGLGYKRNSEVSKLAFANNDTNWVLKVLVTIAGLLSK